MVWCIKSKILKKKKNKKTAASGSDQMVRCIKSKILQKKEKKELQAGLTNGWVYQGEDLASL